MEHINVHMAQLISDALHQFVITKPPRHPVDPEKIQQTTGFSCFNHRSLPVL